MYEHDSEKACTAIHEGGNKSTSRIVICRGMTHEREQQLPENNYFT